jgi:streptomycin 6-kinase
MTIPSSYSHRIIQIYGDSGKLWLESLHGTIGLCEDLRKLKVADPYNLSYNYVVATSGKSAVVKVCIPGDGFKSELNTLIHYDGHGMCRLIDYIEDKGVLLLEMLQPGVNLKGIDENTAIQAISSVIGKMRKLTRKIGQAFPNVSDQQSALLKLANYLPHHVKPIDRQIALQGHAIFKTLIATQNEVYLLHGDLHQENILSHGHDWKTIDPKGIIGEVEYELIPFIINSIPTFDIGNVIEYRINRLSREVGADIERVYAWGLCRALLSICWNIEDNLAVSEVDLAIIDHFRAKTNDQFGL